MRSLKKERGSLLIRRTWPPLEFPRRFLEIFHEEGLRALWFKALGETFYRRMLLMECLLEDLPAPVAPRVPVRFHRLAPSDVDAFRRLRPHIEASEVHRRLDAGDRAFFASRHGRMACALWVAAGTGWIEYLKRPVPLKAGEGYLYEAYTHPDFRGYRIGPALFDFVYRSLRSDGYLKVILAVNLENRSARRAFSKSGERVFARWGYAKLGPWRLDLG